MTLIISVVFIYFLFLVLEKYFLNKSLGLLKIRIHVNGTRGKSTVTELIRIALNSEEIKAAAKITGVIPTFISNKSERMIIKRKSKARLQEQFRIINQATAGGANALILECMSVNPDLQKVESTIFKPHLYIITNIRYDHREQMGRTELEQAESICSAIPSNSLVISAETKYREIILKSASEKNSKVIFVDKPHESILNKIPNGIHNQNISLALAAAEQFGVSRESALERILQFLDQYKIKNFELNINNKAVTFIDGFAVNDTPSFGEFLDNWKSRFNNHKDIILFLNTRNDRPFRSSEFVDFISRRKDISGVVISGNHIPFTKKKLIKNNFSAEKIYIIKNDFNNSLTELLKKIITQDTILFGAGNIAGAGFVIKNYFSGLKTNGN